MITAYNLFYSTGGYSGPFKSALEATIEARRCMTFDLGSENGIELRPVSSPIFGGFDWGHEESIYCIRTGPGNRMVFNYVPLKKDLTPFSIELNFSL